jgi:threonine/homoserine/homoserine lactone efflux protein
MLTDSFPAFLLTALLIELTPGPNMAWLALTGVSAGKRAALAATLGIAIGLGIVALAAAFGVAQLAQNSRVLFGLLKYGGAAYLLWLAWEAWSGKGEVSPGFTRSAPPSAWFRHGVLLNLLNPKAAIFFVAILPNFVVAQLPAMPQTLTLSLAYVAIASIVHLLIALFSWHAHSWFEKSDHARTVRRICSLAIAAVAVWFLAGTAV